MNDIAGVRVICSFPSDIYQLADAFLRQDDIHLINRKDYIKEPKGPTQIAKWLKQQQILNPTAYCHAKGLPTSNKPTADPYKWTNETVSRILERVDYLGHTVNFKTTKQSYKSKKKIWNDPEN